MNSFTNGPKLHKEMILESKNIFSIDVVSKWVLVVGTETLPFQKPNTVMSSFKGKFLLLLIIFDLLLFYLTIITHIIFFKRGLAPSN